jgi:hypothetical protein
LETDADINKFKYLEAGILFLQLSDYTYSRIQPLENLDDLFHSPILIRVKLATVSLSLLSSGRGHRVHTEWRLPNSGKYPNHDGKISPGWWGGGGARPPTFRQLPTRTKLQFMLGLVLTGGDWFKTIKNAAANSV